MGYLWTFHQHEVGGESQRTLGTTDSNDLILDGLAHHFHDARSELGQLIQEEHAAVRHGDLTRVMKVAAAHQAGMADGVVRGAERAAAHQGHIRRELVGY